MVADAEVQVLQSRFKRNLNTREYRSHSHKVHSPVLPRRLGLFPDVEPVLKFLRDTALFEFLALFELQRPLHCSLCGYSFFISSRFSAEKKKEKQRSAIALGGEEEENFKPTCSCSVCHLRPDPGPLRGVFLSSLDLYCWRDSRPSWSRSTSRALNWASLCSHALPPLPAAFLHLDIFLCFCRTASTLVVFPSSSPPSGSALSLGSTPPPRCSPDPELFLDPEMFCAVDHADQGKVVGYQPPIVVPGGDLAKVQHAVCMLGGRKILRSP